MSYQSKSTFFSKTLFERLVDSTTQRYISDDSRAQHVVESIKYNLKNILNSRLGHAQSAPNLGLADFNDATITNADVSAQIKKTIASCILTYEPRIKDLTVQLYNNPEYPMVFEVRVMALVCIEDLEEKVTIDILCDNNTHYKVY